MKTDTENISQEHFIIGCACITNLVLTILVNDSISEIHKNMIPSMPLKMKKKYTCCYLQIFLEMDEENKTLEN